MKTQLSLLLIFLLGCVILIFNLSPTSSNIPRAHHDAITVTNSDDDQSSKIILDEISVTRVRDQVSSPYARLQTSPHYFRDLTKRLRNNHKNIPLLPFEKSSEIAEGAFKIKRGSNDDADKHFVLSEKLHPRASSSSVASNNNNNGFNVVVMGTGAMRSWERCAPRLRSSLLEPNDAFLTLFTFAGFLSEDYLNANFETFYDPVVNLDGESARRKRTKKPSLKNGNNNINQPKVSLDLIPRYSNEQHHEKLLKVYGERHLALSVLLNSSKFVQLAKKKAPQVTFYHYLTVLAQWAVIEYSAAKTMSLLSAISKRNGSQQDYIFVRIRPDIFIIGTKITFSITNTASSKHKDGGKLFRMAMACGGEKNVPLRRENKTTSNNYEFTVPIAELLKSPTFFRTSPFPEQEWPHDPLSDFSSVFIVPSHSSSSVSGKSNDGDDYKEENNNMTNSNNDSYDSLIASSVIARRGFRLWSWMISQPEKANYLDIDGYSYVSPEKVTTNFTALTGLTTKKIPFGWHFLLRQQMYMKVNRQKPKIEKGLRTLFKKVFRTDDPDTVSCPSSF